MGIQHIFRFVEALRDLPYESTKDNPTLRALSNWASEVKWYEGYANGRATPNGVVSGNWNPLDCYNRATKEREEISDYPSRICKLLEKHGVAIEWGDMVSSCDDCDKCIQTEPDSHSWRPEFYMGDGEIVCESCLADNPSDALSEVAHGSNDHHWEFLEIDPIDHDYALLETIKEGFFTSVSHKEPECLAYSMKVQGHDAWLYTHKHNAYQVYIPAPEESE